MRCFLDSPGAGRAGEAQTGGTQRRAASRLTLSFSRFTFRTGSQSVVVVLLLQINRVPGHDFFCVAEKNQSDYLSSRIPSCLYV